MTEGNPFRVLSLFAIPILAGNLLHPAYSVTDSIVAGQCLGQTALAVVGCTAPISMLLAALMIGVNIGVGILISQAYGKRDYEQIRQYLTNGLYLSSIIALFVALVGVSLTVKILHWMGTPAAPLQDAAVYLRINFITAVCPLFYYLLASVMRGIGDSRSALYCLIVSSVANILLDILFVVGFQWGVAGSAWATALAQTLSTAAAAYIICRKYPDVWPKRNDFRWNPKLLINIAKTALPIAFESAFNNISNIIAQSAVNSFGEAAMAAYTAAGRVGTLSLISVETVGNAMSVYAGQNRGASLRHRIRNGVFAALFMCVCNTSLILFNAAGLGISFYRILYLYIPKPPKLKELKRYKEYENYLNDRSIFEKAFCYKYE